MEEVRRCFIEKSHHRETVAWWDAECKKIVELAKTTTPTEQVPEWHYCPGRSEVDRRVSYMFFPKCCDPDRCVDLSHTYRRDVCVMLAYSFLFGSCYAGALLFKDMVMYPCFHELVGNRLDRLWDQLVSIQPDEKKDPASCVAVADTLLCLSESSFSRNVRAIRTRARKYIEMAKDQGMGLAFAISAREFARDDESAAKDLDVAMEKKVPMAFELKAVRTPDLETRLQLFQQGHALGDSGSTIGCALLSKDAVKAYELFSEAGKRGSWTAFSTGIDQLKDVDSSLSGRLLDEWCETGDELAFVQLARTSTDKDIVSIALGVAGYYVVMELERTTPSLSLSTEQKIRKMTMEHVNHILRIVSPMRLLQPATRTTKH